jgi:hypothetical protein
LRRRVTISYPGFRVIKTGALFILPGSEGIIMRVRLTASVVIAISVACSATAFADGLGPHSTWYAVHKVINHPENDVSIVYHRNTHRSLLAVSNFCLGTQPGSGGVNYPQNVQVPSAAVKNGKINFHANATEFLQTGTKKAVPMKFVATLTSTKATGYFSFPGTKCGTIHFVAKRAGYTK